MSGDSPIVLRMITGTSTLFSTTWITAVTAMTSERQLG